jgi:hypothetical protein
MDRHGARLGGGERLLRGERGVRTPRSVFPRPSSACGTTGVGLEADRCEGVFEAFYTATKPHGTWCGIASAAPHQGAWGGARLWGGKRQSWGRSCHVTFSFRLPARSRRS